MDLVENRVYLLLIILESQLLGLSLSRGPVGIEMCWHHDHCLRSCDFASCSFPEDILRQINTWIIELVAVRSWREITHVEFCPKKVSQSSFPGPTLSWAQSNIINIFFGRQSSKRNTGTWIAEVCGYLRWGRRQIHSFSRACQLIFW